MLLVILGAGASFDSAPSLPPNDETYRHHSDRPPLASELFGNRDYFGQVLQKYPDCLPITPRLRELKQGHSVEALLQELQLESTNSPVRKRQIASIRYYLQEILSTCPGQWAVTDETAKVCANNFLRKWYLPNKSMIFEDAVRTI